MAAGAPPPRIDKFIKALSGLSNNKVKSMVKNGHIHVNNSKVSQRTLPLEEGDVVMVFFPTLGQSERFVYPELDLDAWPLERGGATSAEGSMSGSAEDPPKRTRLRPFRTILKKLKSLSFADPDADFVIGYLDRFTGIQEVTLEHWEEGLDSTFGSGTIPQHRVQYVKRNDEKVWDRETRVDILG